MKILAIESSGLVASCALVTEDTMLAEYTVNFKKTHSQTLLPMVDEIVSMVGIELKEMDAIAVSAGPGSFTGLRIGSATAKGLGLALGKPIISTYSVNDEACMPYLEKYPLALMIDERDPDLKKQASRIRDFVYETLGRRVDAEYVKETFKNNLPESCALKIISLAEGKQK